MLYKKDGTRFGFVDELFYVPKDKVLVVRTLGEIHIDTGFELTEYFKRNRILDASLYGFTRPIWYPLHDFVSIYALMPFITDVEDEHANSEAFRELLILYRSKLKSARGFGIDMLENGYKKYVDVMGNPAEYATF
jgi:hypothetical protein